MQPPLGIVSRKDGYPAPERHKSNRRQIEERELPGLDWTSGFQSLDNTG